MQQVPVSNQYNYVNEIAEEINCEKWLIQLFHQAVLSTRS